LVEATIGLLVGYLGRKATGLVDRAARDADVAFDRKVGELYERVRSRLAQRLDPQTVEAVAHGRHEAIQALTNLVANVADEDPEFAAELHQRVKALEASKPPWWCTAVSADRGPVIIGGMSIHGGQHAASITNTNVYLGGHSPQDPTLPGRPQP